jgi:hypothetical protein
VRSVGHLGGFLAHLRDEPGIIYSEWREIAQEDCQEISVEPACRCCINNNNNNNNNNVLIFRAPFTKLGDQRR